MRPFPDPRVSVIIPTYNRSQLLDETLRHLARQAVAPDEFEVIVADDGSADATKDIVGTYADRLRIGYTYQEDLGNRVALARNAGARVATGEILVFLDTGALVGPDFVAGHLRAHAAGRRAVAGYAYGYNPKGAPPELSTALVTAPPEAVVAALGPGGTIRDVRHDALAARDFELERCAIPWMLFWTMNCSIRATDFWAAGGFDESFHGWGLEDMEFAFRVHRHGVPLYFDRDTWVVHAPHERDWTAQLAEMAGNAHRFLAAHPEPMVEIGWTLIVQHGLAWPWEQECAALRRVTATARDDVTADIAARVLPGERTAVFGCGGRLPEGFVPAHVVDFDEVLLRRLLAKAPPGTAGHHAIGLRTPLADQCVDTVVITSRLAGLWPRWSADILAEARRVGATVRTFDTAVG